MRFAFKFSPHGSITTRSRVATARAFELVLAASAMLLGASEIQPQSRVAGQIRVLERGSERTTDLANAVAFLERVDREAQPGSPVTVPIAMESRQFVPRIRVVPVGSTIEFPNHDPFRHNVFSKSGPNEFDLGLYGRGDSRGATLRRAGVFPIFCNIHARMVAFAVAAPTQYFARAASDGRFEIAGVPPGSYTLHVWHDRGGTQSLAVDVGTDGVSEVAVQLDARGYEVVQHKNKFDQEYTTTGRDRY